MDGKERHSLMKIVEGQIDNLIYEEPKCDFEHTWNCAIEKANEVVQSFQDDQELKLNEEKLDEFVIGEKDE